MKKKYINTEFNDLMTDSENLPAIIKDLIVLLRIDLKIIGNDSFDNYESKVICRRVWNCERQNSCTVSKKQLCEDNNRVFFVYDKLSQDYDEISINEFLQLLSMDNNLTYTNTKESEYDLKFSYIKSLYLENAWIIENRKCDYPQENCEDVFRCFYFIVPNTMRETAEALLCESDNISDFEKSALKKTIAQILKIYYKYHGNKEGNFRKHENNEELLMSSELQGIIATILNQDNRYNSQNAADELFVVFDRALTRCYHCIYQFMNENKKKDLRYIIGEEALGIIESEKGELLIFISPS